MEKIEPKVDQIWEMREIAEDFTDPLEVFREAISNAYDANASDIKIDIYKAKQGNFDHHPLVIKISDNGTGMTKEQIEHFWSLGCSEKRNSSDDFIGCKGHGTMIFLKAKYIQIQTTNSKNAYKSFCIEPMKSLNNNKFYEPEIEEIEISKDGTGTEIILEGYIDDETAFCKAFKFDNIKDYILWFTKHGSIEKECGHKERESCKLELKVFDDKEIIEFGHRFAEVNEDIEKLKKEYNEYLPKYFVKKYFKSSELEEFPSYKYEMLFYFEGEEARKQSNDMLKNGKYTESSRYGIYLCKDYIPIKRVNEWVKGFYGGSNGFLRLHGFINCQDFKLTANRGSATLRNQDVMKALEIEVDNFIKEIDKDLLNQGLKKYEEEIKAIQTWEDEKEAYSQRRKNIEEKNFFTIEKGDVRKKVYIPDNETELFYIYTRIATIYPEEFPFEPMDYNATKGIDMLVQTEDQKYGQEYAYVELKRTLDNRVQFNHSFSNLAYILCWEISDKVRLENEFTSRIDGKNKKWKYNKVEDKDYLISVEGSRINIEIIQLKKIFYKYAKEI